MNKIQNTKEAICPITIATGGTGGNNSVTPPAGHIVGCVIIQRGGDNPGMIRAGIKNQAQEPLSEMQAIENYRSREACYLEGCKPLNFIADGSAIYLNVLATAAFTTDFHADLILIYKDERFCPTN